MSDTEERVFTLEIELELATQTIQEMQLQIDRLRQDLDFYQTQFKILCDSVADRDGSY